MSKSRSLCLISVLLYTFLSIGVFDPHKVLCGSSDIFPGQTIWDLSKKFWAPANSQLLRKNTKIKNLIIMSNFLSLLPILVVLYTFLKNQCVLPSRRCSARSKMFFFDKQSETCQKNFHLRQTQSSREKTWKSENLTILCISLTLCLILVIYCMILEYLFFGPSRRCSAGSKIFFCDKQSEICQKKFSAPANSQLLWKTHKSENLMLLYIFLRYVSYYWYFTGFPVSVFITHTRCSAGSQILFLDKQSEICQRKFSAPANSQLLWKTHKSENLMFLSISLPLRLLLVAFYRFFSICVYNPHKVLCGIQDFFLGQTIWDLSNKISAPANSQLLWKTHKSENLIFLSISLPLCLLLVVFLQVFQYLCL